MYAKKVSFCNLHYHILPYSYSHTYITSKYWPSLNFFFTFRFLMVFLCLGLSVFSTIPDNEFGTEIDSALYHLEIVIVIWFGMEFIIRYFDRYSYTYVKYNNYTQIFSFKYINFMYSYYCHVSIIFRLWSSGCRSRYQGFMGRVRFMKSPFCIIGN